MLRDCRYSVQRHRSARRVRMVSRQPRRCSDRCRGAADQSVLKTDPCNACTRTHSARALCLHLQSVLRAELDHRALLGPYRGVKSEVLDARIEIDRVVEASACCCATRNTGDCVRDVKPTRTRQSTYESELSPCCTVAPPTRSQARIAGAGSTELTRLHAAAFRNVSNVS